MLLAGEAKWTSPVSNRLLLESGFGMYRSRYGGGQLPGLPTEDLIPSLLALSDVMGTGWFAAEAANVKPGGTVVVVGDGAVGLLGVLSAKHMGAERSSSY